MPGIRLNGRAYGGTSTVAAADHLICEDGSGNTISAQNFLFNILGNFATVEQSTTASKAYAVGDYLVLNGNLYKVTSAIAAGGAITVGTNVVKTTVGVQITNQTKLSNGTGTIANTHITSAERLYWRRSGNIVILDLAFVVGSDIPYAETTALLLTGFPIPYYGTTRFRLMNSYTSDIVPLELGITTGTGSGNIINQWSQGGIKAGTYHGQATYIAL